ncbi:MULTISPECIES: UDP-glucose/GDP-mannose dehydrogenase family protein [unclassified Paenibacillus]|uniref:UDP-glucose dehydrogenase family protein n=1 Tax=unclassified Paenibacillus TaxID=185978 RepID=UPI001AE8C30C|nr:MULTISPECIES: UDP-glucose/GDP-mannose dehydrogenase family protein [unclassified Paenibacillus]MBP1157456.1 UDPglucose 6-dehydrogenase [Paenibacillus sp. PvP091]MBP1171806.1 UDPglucose 6-dehydrogenase [Paenibacillus sp. PvR098]MBP2438187.1 UDPglucose 6-dehydrogenase [Paenibacillus sp. PvP052]
MKIAVVGTGYVGLVTGVCLSEIGHEVTCIDIDSQKIEMMRAGQSPIYEPSLEELMLKNIQNGRLSFTVDHKQGFRDAKAIYIAVGTPPKADGTANLQYVDEVSINIARQLREFVVVVTKSTVPVGTNDRIRRMILEYRENEVPFDVVSNPEFLREGSAVYDAFHGDRIVIGSDNDAAAAILEEINRPFGIPIFKTDTCSAEMIKYASNAFLATKISFINEISSLCEKLNANVEDVARGMGMDRRIGSQFLKAGIGYGGSCFPKDTKALIQIAGNVEHEFDLLKAVIDVNNKQQELLVRKAKERFGSLKGLNVAVLGLAFKPDTDDMREAASIAVTDQLIEAGAQVVAYDPIAIDNARKWLRKEVRYAASIQEAAHNADALFILTEWFDIKNMNLSEIRNRVKQPIIFDGRNCFDLQRMAELEYEYYSIGRIPIMGRKTQIV